MRQSLIMDCYPILSAAEARGGLSWAVAPASPRISFGCGFGAADRPTEILRHSGSLVWRNEQVGRFLLLPLERHKTHSIPCP